MILTDDFVINGKKLFMKVVIDVSPMIVLMISSWLEYTYDPEIAAYKFSLDDYFCLLADTILQKYNDISRYTCFDI